MTLTVQKLRAPARKKDKLENLSSDEKIAQKRNYGIQVQSFIRQIQISIRQAMARSLHPTNSKLHPTAKFKSPSNKSKLYPSNSVQRAAPSNKIKYSCIVKFQGVPTSSKLHRQTQLATNLTSNTKAADQRIVG